MVVFADRSMPVNEGRFMVNDRCVVVFTDRSMQVNEGRFMVNNRCVVVFTDRSMQVNEGRFMVNNRCGYVLQPDCMRHPSYDPCDKLSLNRVDPVVEPVHISIYVST